MRQRSKAELKQRAAAERRQLRAYDSLAITSGLQDRQSFRAALQLLCAICHDPVIADSKKLRQQIASDVERACRSLERLGSPEECAMLASLLRPLSRTMPVKAFKHVDQVATRALVHRKRTLAKADVPASLLVLPSVSVLQICSHLTAADLVSLLCSCRTLCTIVRGDEQLWRQALQSTSVAQLQPDAFTSAAACASALRNFMVGSLHGHALYDALKSDKREAPRRDPPPRPQCAYDATSQCHAESAAHSTGLAASYIEFGARMPRAGAGRTLNAALQAVAGQSLWGLAFMQSRWRLQAPHTVLLASGSHAICAVTLWEVALRPHGGAAAGWLPVVHVPSEAAPECLHASGACKGLLSSAGVSEDDVLEHMLRRPPPRDQEGSERTKWLRHVRDSLHWACAPWVLQCAKRVPLDDVSSDESVQGLWQSSLRV